MESQGVSAAQAQLHLSQSVISTHLKQLEDHLGMVLCERGRGGFRLTEEGQAVYEACVEFRDAGQALQQRLHFVRQSDVQRGGHVRLAMADELPRQFTQALHRVLADSYRDNPQVHFSIRLQSPVTMASLISNGECDIGIGYIDRVVSGLQYSFALTERQQLYCGHLHPLFACTDPSLSVLENDYAWVKRSYKAPNQVSQLSPKHFTATAFHMEGTQHFILAGTHLGFLPVDVAEPYTQQGLMRAVREADIFYEVAHQWVYKQPLNPVTEQFLQAMQAAL